MTVAVSAQATNTTADRVLGQVDLSHNGANILNAQGLNFPVEVAVDMSVGINRIYVADSRNNRVLGWSSASAFVNGEAANLEIGQQDFVSAACSNGGVNAQTLCNPTSVAVDPSGNLYVADTGNNRVLEYNTPFNNIVIAGVGENLANHVFGQPNFTSSTCAGVVSAATLCSPSAVAVGQGFNVFIADSKNNRVLEYNTPLTVTSTPGSGDTIADMVFGQNNLSSGSCNLGSNTVTASSLCLPEGIAVTGIGNLYIGDTQNNRVLEYNTPVTTGKTAANLVFGQSGFGSNTCDSGGTPGSPGPSSLCTPMGLTVDNPGNLYVADSANSRVLGYKTPLRVTSTPGSGDTVADVVIGQSSGSFYTISCNLPQSATTFSKSSGTAPTPKTLCNAQGAATDNAGNLYVADTYNGRIIEYNAPLSTSNTTGNMVLGKLDFLHGGPNIVGAKGLNLPLSVAIDTTVLPNHVYVADSSNNRVLGWQDESNFVNGAAADLFIGQPDFVSTAINQGGSVTATTLNFPEGLSVDSAGNLWVGDTNNSRVLEFNTPYLKTSISGSGDNSPDFVLGYSNFTTGRYCNGPITSITNPPPNNSFCQAVDVVVDNAGNVYATDANNNRVLEWNSPLATGNTTPDMVFGQSNNFYTGGCNTSGSGSPPSATTMCTTEGVALDTSGNLYVADNLNNRVLEFNSPISTGNTNANMVFGQSTFTSAKASFATSGMNQPRAAVIDAAGNLYVSDSWNNRVLEYAAPLASGSSASLVFGQAGSFPTGVCANSTANDLCMPSGLALDSAGNLYIADAHNNRVLVFNQP